MAVIRFLLLLLLSMARLLISAANTSKSILFDMRSLRVTIARHVIHLYIPIYYSLYQYLRLTGTVYTTRLILTGLHCFDYFERGRYEINSNYLLLLGGSLALGAEDEI